MRNVQDNKEPSKNDLLFTIYVLLTYHLLHGDRYLIEGNLVNGFHLLKENLPASGNLKRMLSQPKLRMRSAASVHH